MMKRSVSVAVLVSLTTVSPGVHALGLAEPDVKSSLSEPLQAQIALTDLGAIDPEHLVVQLADVEAFAQAGMSRSALAESVRMAVSRGNGELHVVLTTEKPVQEPYLDLLLALEWPGGALRRQVTLLLDPPGYATTASLILGNSAQAMVSRSDVSVSALPETTPAQQPGATGSTRDRKLEVLPGDSLWRIAERIDRPSGTSTEQLVVALYRTNPEAFPNGNINSLRAGTMLDVPGPDALTAITAEAARRQLSNQYAAWQADSGEPEAPMSEARPRLTLLSDAELEAEAALLSEASLDVASGVAGADAAIGSGVQATGGTNEMPDSLVKMGEAILASLEENRQASLDALESVRAERDQLQEEIAALRADMAALRSQLAQVSSSDLGVAQQQREMLPRETTVAVEATSAAAVVASSEAIAPAGVEADQEVSEKTSQPALWQGFWRGVSEQMALVGGAAVIVLGAVWAVIRRRQRYHKQHTEDQASLFPSAGHKLGEQAPHVNETYEQPVPASDTVASSGEVATQPDSAPQAEAINEADIFIAYGRYEQARDLLAKSLQDEPDRNDLRLKLLSIHVELGEIDAAQGEADRLLAHAGQAYREDVERLMGRLRDKNEKPDEPRLDTLSSGIATLSGASYLGDTEQTQVPEEAPLDPVAEVIEEVTEEVEAVAQDVERIIDYEPPSLDPEPTREYDELSQPNVDYPALHGGTERVTGKPSGFDELEWEIEEVAFEPLNLDNEHPAASTSKTRSER